MKRVHVRRSLWIGGGILLLLLLSSISSTTTVWMDPVTGSRKISKTFCGITLEDRVSTDNPLDQRVYQTGSVRSRDWEFLSRTSYSFFEEVHSCGRAPRSFFIKAMDPAQFNDLGDQLQTAAARGASPAELRQITEAAVQKF
ncbi:MAG: hypothetical protein JWO82_405 [Akkermansiaceae bacterium]|nr:hypothetical protein [Akkermansiaceae bacterium]